MYFLSGEATCLNVIPDCAVTSVKAILVGCSLRRDFSRKGAKAQRKPQRKNTTKGLKLLNGFLCVFASLREKYSESDRARRLFIAVRPRLFLQLLRDLELALTFRFATHGYVSTPELVMHMGLVGFQSRRDLEILNTSFDITLLQQRLAQFVPRIGEVRLLTNNLPHQRDSLVCFLLGQHDEGQVIFSLEIVGIQRQLLLKFASSVLKFPRLEMNQTGVEVGQPHLIIE